MSDQENINCKNSFRCKDSLNEKVCKKPTLFTPNRRKFIPNSLKGSAAILPAITVCNQDLYLPQPENAGDYEPPPL